MQGSYWISAFFTTKLSCGNLKNPMSSSTSKLLNLQVVAVTQKNHHISLRRRKQCMNYSKTSAAKLKIASPPRRSCYSVVYSHWSNWSRDSPGQCTNPGSSLSPPCSEQEDDTVLTWWLPVDFVYWQDYLQLLLMFNPFSQRALS